MEQRKSKFSNKNSFIIEGRVAIPKDSMFIFSRNESKPECCPATFSTDQGCICTTPQQRKFIGEQRGNNKNFPNGSF